MIFLAIVTCSLFVF
jgi:hypothetical protein